MKISGRGPARAIPLQRQKAPAGDTGAKTTLIQDMSRLWCPLMDFACGKLSGVGRLIAVDCRPERFRMDLKQEIAPAFLHRLSRVLGLMERDAKTVAFRPNLARLAGSRNKPAHYSALRGSPSRFPSRSDPARALRSAQRLRTGAGLGAAAAGTHLCSAKVARYCWRLCNATTSLLAES